MPPLPLQLRLEDYQIDAIDAVRDIRNGASGLSVRLSRQQVISGIIDQWIAAHAEAPPAPPVVVPPAPVAQGEEALARRAAAVAAPVAPAPAEKTPERRHPARAASALQQRVLACVPFASDRPEGIGRAELRAQTQLTESQVDSTLFKLTTRRLVYTVKKGLYVRNA